MGCRFTCAVCDASAHADLVSLALIGQMFGALSGLEYIAILAGETKAPTEDIGRSVVIASLVICAMFILGTGAVVPSMRCSRG